MNAQVSIAAMPSISAITMVMRVLTIEYAGRHSTFANIHLRGSILLIFQKVINDS
jgi:hypothetical protein